MKMKNNQPKTIGGLSVNTEYTSQQTKVDKKKKMPELLFSILNKLKKKLSLFSFGE